MDLKQLIYIVEIAEQCSITKAAEHLYITQSGLNHQLLKLEAELGVQLFHRSKNDFRPTKVGDIYITYAKRILNLKKEAYNIINDIADNKRGNLRIGLTPNRGITMFINTYLRFYEKYPYITIEPKELSVRQQLSLLSKDYLDFGFVTVTEKEKTDDEYIHILDEDILLGIPRTHPMAEYANPPGQPFATIDLKNFAKDSFILIYKESTLRPIIDNLFDEAGFIPKVLFETSNSRALYSAVANHMGCSLLPQAYAQMEDQVAYFYLPSRPSWELAAVYRKNSYQMQAAKDFIQLAADYWQMESGRDCN